MLTASEIDSELYAMRLPPTPISRRSAAAALAALALSAGPRLPARALVEGIPLYAPGDAYMLPEAGFETFLPKLEALRDSSIPALKLALSEQDWAAATQLTGPDVLKQQLAALGSTAALLGDEAYTALAFKARYAAAAKRLQRSLAERNQGDAGLLINEMESSVGDFVALIPQVVVDQVRAREQKLASLATGAAAPSPASEPTAAETPGGFLITPTDAGKKKCGIDIRC